MNTLSRWFDELEPGNDFETRGRTITESDVVGFATLTGDLHPQHTDRHWAAASRFSERIAHGMLVLSYALALIPFDPERVVALRGLDDAVFKRPVRLDDTISVRGSVRELKELDPDHGLVTTDLRVRNQDDELVARARLDAVWRCDPGTAPGGAVEATIAPADSFVPILL